MPQAVEEEVRTTVWSALSPSEAKTGTGFVRVIVPIMLFISSLLMALAWLGHLRFKELDFWLALLACWLIVLPEYMLNISAIRLGHGTYTGAQMAAFNLSSGVVCVALVSWLVLDERLELQQILGFGLMIVAMILIGTGRESLETAETEEPRAETAAEEAP